MSVKESLSEVVTYTFFWHPSPNACKRCLALGVAPIRGQDLFDPILYDSNGLPIWDLDNDKELTHPHGKCTLEVVAEVDMSRAEWFQEILASPRQVMG